MELDTSALAAEELIEALEVFSGLRYFSAVAFIALVFDHIITLDQEIITIWTNPNVRWHSKAAFLINRYLTEAIIAYVVYRTSLSTSPKTITAMLGVLVRSYGNFHSPSYSAQSFFDFALMTLVLFNAMDRPRLTHVEMISGLQKDGAGFFLVSFSRSSCPSKIDVISERDLSALRLIDLIISIFQECIRFNVSGVYAVHATELLSPVPFDRARDMERAKSINPVISPSRGIKVFRESAAVPGYTPASQLVGKFQQSKIPSTCMELLWLETLI
ncbi:hypothetical protein B0H11DRAFT_1935879 [Mycena galericulata]|nr:hypothetical protein B0H11DRAFT_1935879 [Mycena galericulata]